MQYLKIQQTTEVDGILFLYKYVFTFLKIQYEYETLEKLTIFQATQMNKLVLCLIVLFVTFTPTSW